MTSQSAQRVAEISHIAGTAPLPPRRLQELKRGNGKQSVSVQILGEQICSIERGIAQHFSQIWRQRLANPMITIVHVAFPPPAPAATPENAPAGTAPAAPSTTTSATIPGSAPATTPRTQAIDPLEKNTVKFLIQWMQRGGADPVGPNALIYPQGNPAALGKLHQLAVSLKIDPLIARTNVPTASANRQSAARRPKACYKCGQQGWGKTRQLPCKNHLSANPKPATCQKRANTAGTADVRAT
ncbi:MAG: hypothetical protein Q9175_004598 [Cornicularia normoerica]